MESVKKWLSERNVKKNGVYIHYSPPKLVGVVSAAQLRSWARGGPECKLERAVIAGQGRRLLAEAGALPLTHRLPALIARCDALHAAVEKGSLMELQELLESDYNRRKFVLCLDEAGVGLLHKAVYYDYMDIAEYLVKDYPELVHMKDSEGRTPLHYAALCRDEAGAARLLEGAGGARGARDAAGRTPAGYRGPARALLRLPAPPADMARNPPGLVIKRHNIRIWCHDSDMPRLQRVVWEGHGSRLLSEVSNQAVVRKFLEAVPYIMNTIRDIHQAVVDNDIESLMKHAGDPVPPQALSSRDINNMTVMHKAAGLGHGGILKYIAERYSQGVNDVDNDGRTPLHYAAAMRDDQHTYDTLVSLGADESIVDNKNKTPAYYVNRPQEIDKSLFKTIPDAPRTPSSAYPPSWDWKLLDNYVITDANKKTRKKNFRASTENIASKNNTASISESTDNKPNAMKASSTHEFISDLPDLDETKPTNKETEQNEDLKESNDENKETEDVQEIEEPEQNVEEAEENVEAEEIDPEENNVKEKELRENDTYVDANATENEENSTNQTQLDDDFAKKENPEETQVENAAEDAVEKEAAREGDSDTEVYNEEKDDIKNHTSENDNKTSETEEEQHRETEDHHIKDTSQDDDIKENGYPETHLEDETEKEVTDTGNKNNDGQNETINESQIEQMHNFEGNDQREEEVQSRNENFIEKEDNPANEGNNNSSAINEDDDDVQVQGDTSSEYSEYNLKSTAEASETGSAKIGHESNGRNSQESLIEGIVSGEGELETQDASRQRDESVHGEVLVVDNEIDPEVTDLINTANMEMLATLVLNGEGSRLIGRRSGNSELEGFLDNVPLYMQKINQVHVAAREGNLKDLQSALDRRKFAIARDPISPNGATPMHVATVFGKTNIIKYLGSRFPETLSAVDFEGRTALHYAAVLPDNGHYYNLMQQLGANSKDLDDNGRSAEDYHMNTNLLPFDQLLSDFGISDDAAQSMFSDKGSTYPDNGHMDIPIFHTEEGRYLAKSLGDPLIKGLTEVANVKPKDPVAFLATFLHNFPEHEKPRIGTPQVQESEVVVAQELEMENDEAPAALVAAPMPKPPRSAARTATRPHRPIDVVTVDPQPVTSPDAPETASSSAKRDEHGQSMLHFAAARTHARNALFQLLQESDVSLGYRDELYRTARDVSTQANVPENTAEIDRFVLHMAARGQIDKIMDLLMEGYDHILDVVDEEGVTITDVISQRGLTDMSNMLASIPAFEESRDVLLGAVRRGDLPALREAVEAEGGRTLVHCKNSFGRTALHIAVLAQNEEIVAYLAQNIPELLRVGDNLERTPLHYAMGVQKIESLSRALIRAGAKRVLKDLKGRQPSYYFMNKSDILRLQEEEEIY